MTEKASVTSWNWRGPGIFRTCPLPHDSWPHWRPCWRCLPRCS